MKIQGFTLIEIALGMVVLAIVFGGMVTLVTAAIANQQNTVLNRAFEDAKSTAVLAALNGRGTSTTCAGPAGSCAPSGGCVDPSPCAVTTASYPIPASVVTLRDPWGQQIVYVQNTTIVTAFTAPSTIVFTLTSLGPDGVPGSDDIIRPVTAAEFVLMVARIGL